MQVGRAILNKRLAEVVTHSFRLPDIGEGVVEGEVVEWLVAIGESILEDQPLLSVMTDKATVEIPSPVTGIVTRLTGDVGDILPVGQVCAEFEINDDEITETSVESKLEDEDNSALDESQFQLKSKSSSSFRPISMEDDPEEIIEWRDSIISVNQHKGTLRAHHVLASTVEAAKEIGVPVGELTETPYLNTIPPHQEPDYPGNTDLENRIQDILRWNAMMMVTRANKRFDGIGGHISTYASIATLWEVGLNHIFRGKDGDGHGDHVYWQGHASPGLYARSWMEGRFDIEKIEHFRREAFTSAPAVPVCLGTKCRRRSNG